MADAEETRAALQAIQGHLHKVSDDVEAWLRTAIRDLGIQEPRIEARVKEPHSFVLKMLKKEKQGKGWTNPLQECTDKVGVRADLVHLEDVKSLCDHIESAHEFFESIRKDDKAEAAGVDRLGYQGVHFDVTPKEVPDGLPVEQATCEIQVRTNAQAAWAMAAHDLTYKAPVNPPDTLMRQINRLTALLELVDESVNDARKEMMGLEGYPLAIVINALEAARTRYLADHYDKELTRDLAEGLLGDMDADKAHELARSIEQFRQENDGKLHRLLTKDGNPFLAQPESVLIFYLLDSEPAKVAERWQAQGLPYALLDELALGWGRRLPQPH